MNKNCKSPLKFFFININTAAVKKELRLRAVYAVGGKKRLDREEHREEDCVGNFAKKTNCCTLPPHCQIFKVYSDIQVCKLFCEVSAVVVEL